MSETMARTVKNYSLSFWSRAVIRDPFFKSIIDSSAMQRLNGISFLGAVDYTTNKEISGSRFEHSLAVAAIARFVCDIRQYSEELTRSVVAAALLHDIGHLPLSHSVEPVAKTKLKIGHHEQGCKIIRGELPIGKSLHKLLENSLDTELLLELIDGNAADEFGGDIFSNPVNVDTIDGICRTTGFFKRIETDSIVNRVALAEAIFGGEDAKDFSIIDRFWKMKHDAYDKMINSPLSVLSDQLAQLSVKTTYFESFDETAIQKTEREWQRDFPDLFELLYKMRIDAFEALPETLEKSVLDIVSRDYRVNSSMKCESRYVATKSARHVILEDLWETYIHGRKSGLFGIY